MALNANDAPSGNRIEPMEPGAYPGVLMQVIDLGMQNQRPFKGQDKPPAHSIMFTYEFLDEFLKDEDGQDILDKPRWLSEDMPLHPLTAERAKSTIRYNALDPTGEHSGDLAKLVGKQVTITVSASPGSGKNANKTYNNIMGVSLMREKEMAKAPDTVNVPSVFDLDQMDTWEVFKGMSQWLQERIRSNLEYKGSAFAEWADALDGAEPAKEAVVDVEEEGEENPY